MAKKKKIEEDESIKQEGVTEEVIIESKEENNKQSEKETVISADQPSVEETLKMQVSEANDKYLRLVAEFDNYKKRTLRERMDLIKTAGQDILIDILPVVDDFERALANIDNAKDIESVKKGVSLIYGKFSEFLKQKGIVAIDALNQKFATDKHETITKIPASNDELKGKVIDVVTKGYCLNEKVIRFAQVVVGE